MLMFFYIILALLFTSATVYGLHRYQTMEVEFNVDRTLPLPPLPEGYRPDVGAISGSYDADVTFNEKSGTAADKAKIKNPEVSVTQPEQTAAPTKTRAQNWQTQINAAKKAGNLDQAYQICRQHYPLWGAYNQACIILRSRLKSAPHNTSEHGELLLELYRTAVIAEMLHEKSTDSEHFTLQQLRELPLAELANADFIYAKTGYAQLRLIRKSDVKQLLDYWGRPDKHDLPRAAHPEIWARMTINQSA